MIPEARGEHQSALSGSGVASSGPLSIWIVEDNASDVVLVNLALRRLNLAYDLRHIADGEAAIRVVSEIQSVVVGHLPDLVFLDLNLPKRDGLEVLQVIRCSSRFRDVPVAILTSSAIRADKKATADLGANRYVQKIPDLEGFFNSISSAVLALRARDGSGIDMAFSS